MTHPLGVLGALVSWCNRQTAHAPTTHRPKLNTAKYLRTSGHLAQQPSTTTTYSETQFEHLRKPFAHLSPLPTSPTAPYHSPA
jgi:hypothetical protein